MEIDKVTPMMPHTKRYRLIFSIWGHNLSDSVTDYDTLEEVQEEARLLKDFYKDTPRPKKSEQTKTWSFSDGSSFWGYIILDYDEQKILDIYRDGIRFYTKKISKNLYKLQPTKIIWVPEILGKSDRLKIMDTFFRDPSEIPEDYKWDGQEEYEGWLKYRWGDGSNAIKPKEPKKHGRIDWAENQDPDPQEEYDKEIEREWKERKLDHW